MARPTTKKDLIETANEQYNKLWNLIDSISDEEQNKVFNFDKKAMGKEAHWERDNNIRDALIHLYEWHQLLLNWVDNNMKGIDKQFLLEPYNWKTYGKMNVEFWRKHQNTPYNKSKELLKNSHTKVLKLIESLSNEELFEKGSFKWTGGSTLGQYCVSVTSSHYDWAMKKIKAHIKTLK
ncbi:MAG: ClbS/DfsB family four-helix bundle protein [Bacilli bacterium]|nr:ClbS/DfsB family four-helix bundle protein [Bacilli bacterium]MDD4795313.1 ClbS/DfsB family four-helix bundle protein [Bacilli bacterium]